MSLFKRTLVVFFLISLTACQGNGGLGTTEKGALTGGALGAGLGAIVGHATGHTGAGIAIGSGAGLLAGGAVGSGVAERDRQIDQRGQSLAEQERRLAENRQLIEELRNRGADARSTKRGVVVNLPDVLFEFDKSKLTSSARRTTKDIGEVISSVKGRNIYVEGHTDSDGTLIYNQKLSEDRAWTVADDLVGNGVDKGALFVKGYGENDPIASNSTEAGRKRNRRVEVIIGNN